VTPTARFLQEKVGMITLPIFVASPPTHHHNSTMIPGMILLTSGVILAAGAANLPGSTLDAMFAILTLAGAIVASSTAFLLNPTKETAKVKIGRAFIAGVSGVVGTRLLGAFWDDFRLFVEKDQILMFGAGFAFGIVGFSVAVVLVKSVEQRAQSLVDRTLDWGQTRFIPGSTYQTQMEQERRQAEAAKLKDPPPPLP